MASAIRFIAKAVLTGGVAEEFFSDFEVDKIRRNLTGESGLGRDVIVVFLKGVPGINDGSVQQQLANLKSCGAYADARAGAGRPTSLRQSAPPPPLPRILASPTALSRKIAGPAPAPSREFGNQLSQM